MFSDSRDLSTNEKVMYCAKFSLWNRFHHICLGILTIPLLVGIFILIKLMIESKSTCYIVTNKRFIASSGFLSRKTEYVDHTRALGLEVNQSFLGRIFDYGTITVRMPLAGEGDFSEVCISAPYKFAEYYGKATAPRKKTSGGKK